MLFPSLEDEFNNLLPSDLSDADIVAPRLREALWQPAVDFLNRPSKAFRGRIVDLGWALAGAAGGAPEQLCFALECLHAGSLIVDDIEDGSTHRRGSAALHVTHGLPIALNTGNWLYFAPLRALRRLALPADVEIALLHRLLDTLSQCHAGQALDLSVRVTTLAKDEIRPLVNAAAQLKTGALMAVASTVGAIAAGAAPERVDAIHRFGVAFGVGLQMLDDLKSLHGRVDATKRYEDLRLDRLTWPWAWLAEGLDPASFDELRALGRNVAAQRNDPRDLALRMIAALGDEGRAHVERHLEDALAGLRRSARDVPGALEALKTEVDRLLASYG